VSPEPDLLRGLDLLRRRAWFDAHEALEEVWQPEPAGPRRELLQGLIQLAVALEHLRRGNPAGADTLWGRARARWRGLDPWAEGIGIGPWAEATGALFAAIDLPERARRHRAGEDPAGLPPVPPAGTWPVPPLAPELARRLPGTEPPA